MSSKTAEFLHIFPYILIVLDTVYETYGGEIFPANNDLRKQNWIPMHGNISENHKEWKIKMEVPINLLIVFKYVISLLFMS